MIRLTMMEVIPYEKMRYPTVGDYFFDEHGTKHIQVADMGNADFHLLVQIHELVEEHLTRKRGLTEEEILAFDIQFEKEREAGLHSHDEENGFAQDAPYRREHTIATGIEMTLAGILGIDWAEYDRTVNALGEPEPLKPPKGSQWF